MVGLSQVLRGSIKGNLSQASGISILHKVVPGAEGHTNCGVSGQLSWAVVCYWESSVMYREF